MSWNAIDEQNSLTIDDRYKSAYRLLLETRDQLEHLETGLESSDILQGIQHYSFFKSNY